MDLPNILNERRPAAAVTEHLQQQTNAAVPMNGRTYSETGSEGMSSHMSEHSSGYSTRSGHIHSLSNLANVSRFPISTQSPQSLTLGSNGYMGHNGGMPDGFSNVSHNDIQIPNGDHNQNSVRSSTVAGAVKAFACNNCGKAFARRSDLARHGKTRE